MDEAAGKQLSEWRSSERFLSSPGKVANRRVVTAKSRELLGRDKSAVAADEHSVFT
jgi:hypothetical protein